MNDRIINHFLKNGLINVGGQDDRLEKILATATALTDYLRQTPTDIIPFLYTALDPDAPSDDVAIVKTRDLLEMEWATYANVFDSTPTALLRAIVLDAVVVISNEDQAVETALAVMIASALPHLDLGSEAHLWTNVLTKIQERVERRAEHEWSVPSQIDVPAIDMGISKSAKVPVAHREVDLDTLTEGMEAAAGPQNEKGESTEDPNPHWPDDPTNWAFQFAPRAARVIKHAVDDAVKTRVGPIKLDALLGELPNTFSQQLHTVLDRVATATQGLELRSRLLWWREAFYSPSARLSYRNLNAEIAAPLMAYDYQVPLPALTPASVVAFLRETFAALPPEFSKKQSLKTLLASLVTAEAAAPLHAFISGVAKCPGRQPLVVCLQEGINSEAVIDKNTVYNPAHELTVAEFGVLIFLELQTLKAVAEIQPKAPTPDNA